MIVKELIKLIKESEENISKEELQELEEHFIFLEERGELNDYLKTLLDESEKDSLVIKKNILNLE